MLKLRKLATALVLGLIMCLALFGTGAFAQGWGGSTIVAAHSTAIAGEDFFFGPDAFASNSVFVSNHFGFFGW